MKIKFTAELTIEVSQDQLADLPTIPSLSSIVQEALNSSTVYAPVNTTIKAEVVE